ncbi:dTDP-4-dehydrorhamnose 3,5-epimerase [Microvirga brassicacearum]|uniref:dTDP-4-dehydrorhamnose 3,5-epimerase n=1 Tax=Microvirga brassicacearum TaxID=2580413 RepID=A0A5N3PHS4_9HYPH|nr:dTDP-4-dehydrorhamnose 3,5-epimerase [Microvirga brassicacearum]KAB0269278.1 dTDP-4-dehydrorhamnose 3,5-epimerase [Microvirga brassicacearum]
MVRVEPTQIPDVKIVRTTVFTDARGYFVEDYNQRAFAEAGIHDVFVQDNSSFSTRMGTIRGLHFQTEPFAQAKLVRVGRGRILDVVVDLRRSSSTYGQHIALELSADDRQQLFVPVGFAHGFCTLEPDTEVHYKVTAHYSPAHDRGLAWNDPALGIDWPVGPAQAMLSDKDKTHPLFADLPASFS